MKKTKRMAALLTAALVGASTLLGACSSSGTDTSTAAASGGEAAAGTEAGSAQADSGEAQKSSFTMEFNADPGSLAPNSSGIDSNFIIRCYYYEKLFDFGYDTPEIQPILAKGYEWLDDHRMQIDLWEDIYTTDGNNITAEDVLWSMEQCANSTQFVQHTRNIDFEQTEVTDPYTIVVYFKNRNQFIFNDLSRIDITSKASFEASQDGMVTTPVGSGPYIVTQYDAGTQIVLEKNENYWKTAEDHDGLIPKQNVDQIICRFIAEDAQKTIALESGDVDYLFECPSIAISDYQNSDEINLYSINATNCEGLYFNCTEGSVCSNQLLRQAICYAVDTNAIVSSVLGGVGGIPATQIASHIAQEYQPDKEYYPYDPEKAKELLAQAGYAEGELNLRLVTDNTNNRREIAEIIQQFLSQVGINVTIETIEASTSNARITETDTWDMIMSGYACVTNSVLFYFYNQLSENNSRGGWKNDEYQALLDQAVIDGDLDLAMQCVEIVEEAAPILPTYYVVKYQAGRKGIDYWVNKYGYTSVFPNEFTYNEDATWLYD